jgi:ankyrin repeat protein
MGASIKAQTRDGWTCLMSACSNGHLFMARTVVAAGCDVNTQTKVSQPAFITGTVVKKLNLLILCESASILLVQSFTQQIPPLIAVISVVHYIAY